MIVDRIYSANLGDYHELRQRIIRRRTEADRLFEFLETLGYLTAPASSTHHGAYAGGLLRHSIQVARNLLSLRDVFGEDISDETCILVGLCHDVGKLGTRGRPLYVPQGEGYAHSLTTVFQEVPIRSVEIVSRFLPLTTWESQAIVGHDGQYVTMNRNMAHRETPLTLLLHFADMWACHKENSYMIPDEQWLEGADDS